ncbi:fibrinogen C domain-containing protein 1 [Biomphalaria glabrata]|uniref:Fibrinogen C domain-containing protein 1 n=1 Tax=Biomphalaria glabrata TaxID=6526 RepID=A0A9W2YQZ1_BIOGL|nr:fibrinogen C domain-containing protein 1 [Biomphalaria glabrata]
MHVKTNSVIATINKDQPIVTTKQESNFNIAKGELSDTKTKASFIEISWSYLKSSESGKYFCGAHVMKPDGRSERLNEMLAIIVSNPTFDDLVKIIPKLLRQADKEKKNILENKQNIYHIKVDIKSKQENIISIKDELDTNSQNIKSITDDLNANKQSTLSYIDELNSLRQTVNNIQGDISICKESIKKISSDLDTNKRSIARHNDELNTLRQIVDSLKDDLRTNKQSLQDITDEVNTKKENINQLKEDLESNKQKIQNITQEVNTNRQSIINLNKDVNTSQQNLSKLEADLETQLTNLSTALTQINEKIEKGPPISCRDISDTQNHVIVKLLSGLKVMCDTKTDGGGWIIFQRRINGKVDFYRDWKEYRDGFGDYNIGEFYLGNENIFKLTSTEEYDLRIDLEFNNTKYFTQYNNKTYFAQYENFKVLSETDKYKLQIGNYSGNAGDDLSPHNNMFFTTFDRDNDVASDLNCAEQCSGAWWYKSCHDSNLNGQWGRNSYKGMNWEQLTRYSNSVYFSEMKIREREKNYFN